MDKTNMKQIGGFESFDDGGSFNGSVEIEFKKFDELSEEVRQTS